MRWGPKKKPVQAEPFRDQWRELALITEHKLLGPCQGVEREFIGITRERPGPGEEEAQADSVWSLGG